MNKDRKKSVVLKARNVSPVTYEVIELNNVTSFECGSVMVARVFDRLEETQVDEARLRNRDIDFKIKI